MKRALTKMIQTFEVWHKRIVSLCGLRRSICLIVMGVFAALSFPPVYLVPTLIPSIAILIWSLDRWRGRIEKNDEVKIDWQSIWGSFLTGWFFGFGFFVAGFYWISLSLLVDSERWAWMLPFSIVGLGGFFAIYIGLVSSLSCIFASPGPRRILYFALFWTVFEWLRGWAFTGFPWNLIGSVWTFNNEILQFASYFGVLGLSLMTVSVCSCFAILGYSKNTKRFKFYFCFFPVVMFGVIWLGGWFRLSVAENRSVDDILLRLVQPNIKQKNKWNPKYRERHLKNLIELSKMKNQSPEGRAPTHIVWPETSIPYILDGDSTSLRNAFASVASLQDIRQVVPNKGALFVGSIKRTVENNGDVKLWNSFDAIAPNGKIMSTFNKFHLVPFGEYTPFKKYFERLFVIGNLIKNRIDFSAGRGPVTMQIPGMPPFSPLICYEVIFSGSVIPSEKKTGVRPQWLLNTTNDAWFGFSSGPFQHLAAAQLRAVEEGLPLIRVANTGVSAVIDGYGRIIKSSLLNQRIYLDVKLPRELHNKTYYSKHRNIGVLIIILFCFIASRHSVFLK